MSADVWAARGPSTLALDRVEAAPRGRPREFSAVEARQRDRARALKWWNEVGKARRAAKRKESRRG